MTHDPNFLRAHRQWLDPDNGDPSSDELSAKIEREYERADHLRDLERDEQCERGQPE